MCDANPCDTGFCLDYGASYSCQGSGGSIINIIITLRRECVMLTPVIQDSVWIMEPPTPVRVLVDP